MKSSDQADAGADWRMQLHDLRTMSALREGSPPADAVERLPDRVLRAAALNPDHSEAARVAAAAELRARRLSPEPWRLRVNGFLRPWDLARGDRSFFGWGSRASSTPWFVIAVLAISGLTLGALQSGAIARWREGVMQLSDFIAVAIAMLDAPAVYLSIAAVAIVAFVVVAAVVRRRPARVTLVRPSDTALLRAPSRRMLARELRPYGHVISLAPRTPSWRTLRSAAGYRALARRLSNRVAQNLTAAFGGREVVAIAASEAWRPLVFRLLADSSDALVADLSDDAAAMLTALQEEGVVSRCVFVSLWGKAEAAEAALRSAGLDAPVFAYAPDGEMQRRARFRAEMLKAMRATHGLGG